MGEILVHDYGRDPFVLLVACLLSLRARDVVTYPVCCKLFGQIRTPSELVNFPRETLEEILRPIGFYRVKAATLQAVASYLLENFEGLVPQSESDLLSIPGVGRKTANFMRAYAFQVPAICVDTHVHRLANLFGWVDTQTVEQTEHCLMQLVPSAWWARLNNLLVMWGQNVCRPIMSRTAYQEHLRYCPCAKRFYLE